MQQNPKVSILIPAKNETHFVKDCLHSIQKQTFQNWEVILVDDHSTDDTNSIVKSIAEKDSRIKCLMNQGQGIISALRTAYELASGDFITRMDADDLMRPNKIEVLYNGLIKHGKGHVAVGGVHYFAETNLKSGFKNYQKWLNKHTAAGTNFTDIFKECVIPSPCWMLSREDLDGINAFNEERYPEDYDLAFRMYAKGYEVIPTDQVLHDWRDYATRTSRTSDTYKEYTFTEIKWYYFNLLHRDSSKQLLVMGTGYRGKKIAHHLIQLGIDFLWISNNDEKIGKHIYNQMIYDLSMDLDWKNIQCIGTVASEMGKKFLEDLIESHGGEMNKELFHFC
ncbi:MAG TPA: glycosyltransferase family 2 protein [Brumimicrobium sp.]|nr:glycosyltransferase family 2 protein [Brumimicrobium sp.]